jgi:hypothetical protein
VVCSNSSAKKNDFTGISFARVYEPREAAFTILMPHGWQSEGGIYRVNAAQAGGPLNAIEAKCDLLFKSDAGGTVAFRILQDIVCGQGGIRGGFFGPGSNYQGAMVTQHEYATTHVKSIFSAIHGGTLSPNILKLIRLPGEMFTIPTRKKKTPTPLCSKPIMH